MGTQATRKASLLTPHVWITMFPMVPLWRLQWVPINGPLWMLQVFWSRASSLTGWDVDWDQYQKVESTNTKITTDIVDFFFWHSTLATQHKKQDNYIIQTGYKKLGKHGLDWSTLTKPSCNHQPLQVQSPPQPLEENAFTSTQIYWTIPKFLPKWSTANRFELNSIGRSPALHPMYKLQASHPMWAQNGNRQAMIPPDFVRNGTTTSPKSVTTLDSWPRVVTWN